MGNRLKDKVAIVTGSGRGVGRGVALLLASEGAKVVVNDLGAAVTGSGASAAPADDVVAEIKKAGGVAVANYDSVATVEGGENIVKTAINKFGRLDILVNNAGILRDRMIFNMAPEEWDAVMKVHLYGCFNCTKPASIVMRQQRWGRIISMSSTSGIIGNSGQANYGAAKMGIVGFTFVCAKDLGKYGITVNAVAPAAATRMTLSDEVMQARKIRAERGLAASTTSSTQGPPDPEGVAPIVAYLATEQASNINGRVFWASGGNLALFSNPYMEKTISKNGTWTLDELMDLMPKTLAKDVINPAPSQKPEEKK